MIWKEYQGVRDGQGGCQGGRITHREFLGERNGHGKGMVRENIIPTLFHFLHRLIYPPVKFFKMISHKHGKLCFFVQLTSPTETNHY